MMTRDDIVLQRITPRAKHYLETYQTSQQLIQDAVQEALPWAVQLYTNNSLPRLAQLETLCSQLLAVLVASEPKQ